MSSQLVPNRSPRGCLTCKQRKKKCDETRPTCLRCSRGGLQCLGYASSTPSPSPISEGELLTGQNMEARAVILKSGREGSLAIPRRVVASPFPSTDVIPFILSQYARVTAGRLFRTFPFPIEEALLWRIEHVNTTRWTMFLGARIAEAVWNGNELQPHLSWITRLGDHLSTKPPTTLDVSELDGCLSGLLDLYFCAFVISNSAVGYPLFQKSALFFSELVSRHVELWTRDSTLSLHATLHFPRYEISLFVFCDTFSSMVFGTAPLVCYDTTSRLQLTRTALFPFLEWIYGCSADIVVSLAQINSFRASGQLAEAVGSPRNKYDNWLEIEHQLHGWKPAVDYVDGPTSMIARLTIYESWRQAALIYLYMGMCGVNSADPRVESSVHQVIQLASTFESGSTFEEHMLLPALIAGAVARKEKHRDFVRSLISRSRGQKVQILRGADFVPVLDHLWHGAGTGGYPTTWDDYVSSRCATLPLNV